MRSAWPHCTLRRGWEVQGVAEQWVRWQEVEWQEVQGV